MNHQEGCELTGKKEKKQCDDDQPQAEEQQRPQLVARAACQGSSKSHSRLPLPVASCSDQGQGENAMAAAASDRMKSPVVEVAAAQDGEGRLPAKRGSWGDCLPHVVLLREALLSSAPDIAVRGPLYGCFTFYKTHLHNDVLSSTYAKTMTFGANVTRLESAFMWIGGWRPTSALVLVYSLMGIDIENALESVHLGRDVAEGSTASLLSTRQLAVMHSLQKHTQHAEMRISKKLTVLQMLIGDQDMLEAVLRDAASPVANDSSRFDRAAEKRMSRFRRLLVQAEELRFSTLKDLLDLLTPIQAAKCGVAVFEICSSLRAVGSSLPPSLPARAMVVAGPVVVPSLPALIGRADQPLLPGVADIVVLNPSSCSQSDEPVVSEISTSHDNLLKPSDIPISQSIQPLVSDVSSSSPSVLLDSDIPMSQSDETARLAPSCSDRVPSCSDSSTSQLLAQDSSRALKKDHKSRSWPTLLPLAELSLDGLTDGDASSTRDGPKVGRETEGKIVSNRLLVLSPATSDVVIQDCSLDSAGLPFFELRAQRSLASDDMGVSFRAQPGSNESEDAGGSCQIQPGRMSAPCECAEQGPQSKEGRKE